MLQTVYAILALMTFMLFSINNQQHILRSQIGMIRSEVELMGNGVAVERLEELGAVAFDDLDLLHNTKDTTDVIIGSDTLAYVINTEVTYAQKNGNVFIFSATPTPFKEVTLNIEGLLDASVTMSRIYSHL